MKLPNLGKWSSFRLHALDNPRSGGGKFAEKSSLAYRYRPEGGGGGGGEGERER